MGVHTTPVTPHHRRVDTPSPSIQIDVRVCGDTTDVFTYRFQTHTHGDVYVHVDTHYGR